MSPWSNDLVSLLKLPLVESSAGGDILTGAGSGRITTVHRRTMELLGCTMFPRHSREIMKNRNSQWTIEKEMWRPEASSAVYKKAFIFFSGRTKKNSGYNCHSHWPSKMFKGSVESLCSTKARVLGKSWMLRDETGTCDAEDQFSELLCTESLEVAYSPPFRACVGLCATAMSVERIYANVIQMRIFWV